jgi:hypothetical protein
MKGLMADDGVWVLAPGAVTSSTGRDEKLAYFKKVCEYE